MAELSKKFNTIISDIEKNLKNKEDFEYVKKQIYNIYSIFIEEFDKLEKKSNKKMDGIMAKYKVLEDRMESIENSIDKIEEDIYINDEEEYTFDVTCPYCSTEFSIENSSQIKNNNIVCPKCNNTIELDWDEHEGCSHNCCDCEEDCNFNQDDIEDM